MHDAPWPVITAFAVFKGLLVASVTLLIGTTFGQSLVVALVSGGLGLIGMVVSARMAVREARRNREELYDIKDKLGANRRREEQERAG